MSASAAEMILFAITLGMPETELAAIAEVLAGIVKLAGAVARPTLIDADTKDVASAVYPIEV